MNRELIIDGNSSEVVIALLEDKMLVELHKEQQDKEFTVGDIYIGKVKRLIGGLNASFVDVGYEKDAFLHYLDLGPQIKSCLKFFQKVFDASQPLPDLTTFKMEEDIPKTGKINQVLQNGQKIVVKIAKEPISSKGPRVISELSFPGRYLVLVPFSNKIAVSQKIKDIEERNRLRTIVQPIRPNNFGLIIRTVAENKSLAELNADIDDLMQKWQNMLVKIRKANPPEKVHSELSRSFSILRDLLNETFNNIYVNNFKLYNEVKDYILNIAPEKIDIIKFYNGKTPIFEHFGIEKQIKNSFGKRVPCKNGAYLIIEHTEAFHSIDVNSGYNWSDKNSQEDNALKVNLDAAEEVARQLRLRDIGGIIVIDFIDMQLAANRRLLYERLKELMKSDRAKHTILPPSKFGLVQITRQRVRPVTNIETNEKCPICEGSGKIKDVTMFIDEIKSQLQYLIFEQNEKKLKLHVSPFLYAYLKKGIFSLHLKWCWEFKTFFSLKVNKSYHFLEYHFFNKNNDEIYL